MDKDEAIKILNEGKVSAWNQYRQKKPDWSPDLSGKTISGDLLNANLAGTNLCGTDLSRATLFDKSATTQYVASRTDNAIFRKAKYDINTQFPSDVDPIEAGAEFLSQSDIRKETGSFVQVFISYAWANDKIIHAIDAWLQKKGMKTKLDKRDFFAGARIRDEIMRTMKECEIILIFHSKDSANKPWPEFERELASDLEMAAKKEGKQPPRIIYVVIDDSSLPSISEESRIAIKAKGKRFEMVCEEIYHNILKIPKDVNGVDLDQWSDYVF